MEYSKYLSYFVKELDYSGIDSIFEKAARMDDVVNLAMGQPDFNTPENVSKAGIKAIEEHRTKYTDDYGIEELRVEISNKINLKYGLQYNPHGEIIVLAGVNSAIDTTLRAIINPGDEIIVHQPNYSTYVPIIKICGGVPVTVDTYMNEGFKLKPDRLKEAITNKTKALIISYPNNPTGAVMTREDYLKIRDVVEDCGILVLSDEIYSEMVYEGEHVSFASLTGMKEKTITLNGVSKAYSMPGWRVGYACGPHDIIDAVFKVHQNTVMNVPSISQYAAVEALRNCEDYCAMTKKVYDERRRYVFKRFNDMGLNCFEPKGAFHIFPSISGTGLGSDAFASRLLQESRVAVVPGTEFGSSGEGFIRCCYAANIEKLAKGMDRIEAFIKSL
jgi:aminotransferase